MLDVGWGDLIDYLGDDPNTHSIVIYMESIGDARAFLSAAREVALTKPIIVIKAGRTDAGGQGRGIAYRLAGRQRRGAGSGLPARGRAAGEQHRRLLLHGGSAGQAAAARRAEARDRHQRGRPGRARDRCAAHSRRRAGRAFAGDHRGAQQHPAAALEPQQSHRHSRRRGAGALRENGGDWWPKIRTWTACW